MNHRPLLHDKLSDASLSPMNTHVLDYPAEIPSFEGAAYDALKDYYAEHGLEISEATNREKILALQIRLGPMNFSAYGGGETDAMETRALEHVFLIENGIDI